MTVTHRPIVYRVRPAVWDMACACGRNIATSQWRVALDFAFRHVAEHEGYLFVPFGWTRERQR